MTEQLLEVGMGDVAIMCNVSYPCWLQLFFKHEYNRVISRLITCDAAFVCVYIYIRESTCSGEDDQWKENETLKRLTSLSEFRC